MAIAISGRIVKARSKSELKRVENRKATKELVASYNHLRVQFVDGADRHFLFTDKQISTALSLAKEHLVDEPKLSWVREFWYEGLFSNETGDAAKDIKVHGLPAIAKKYNHIRVSLHDTDMHLLFADSAIRSAMNRAQKVEEKLPKASWLSDSFEVKKLWVQQEKSEPEKAPEIFESPSSVSC